MNFNYSWFWLGLRLVQIEPNSACSNSCLGRKRTKEVFASACLPKKFWFSYGNFRLFRMNCDYSILKIGLFHRFRELSESNHTWDELSLVYVECRTKVILLKLSYKKSKFFIRKFAITSNTLRLLNFKKRYFWSGQGVIQIQPHLGWIIPSVCKM